MYEIITLHKKGNPDKDWSVYTKHYARKGNAERTMWRLLHSGMYQAIILRDEKLQDRDDLIRRMNDHLRSDYYRRLQGVK